MEINAPRAETDNEVVARHTFAPIGGEQRITRGEQRITREEAIDRAARAWLAAERLQRHEAEAAPLRSVARRKDQAGS